MVNRKLFFLIQATFLYFKMTDRKDAILAIKYQECFQHKTWVLINMNIHIEPQQIADLYRSKLKGLWHSPKSIELKKSTELQTNCVTTMSA